MMAAGVVEVVERAEVGEEVGAFLLREIEDEPVRMGGGEIVGVGDEDGVERPVAGATAQFDGVGRAGVQGDVEDEPAPTADHPAVVGRRDLEGGLALPADVAATGFRYDLTVEFTRTAGRHSVGVILPTSSGTGIFELDAWELGLGGLQAIDGRDMRARTGKLFRRG